jgi:phosphoglycolate phosphatase/putative hydrolase of the HAD superfamily
MKICRLPAPIAALLFDMDGTLYSNEEYIRTQRDLPMKKLAEFSGRSLEAMEQAVSTYQALWAASHGGRRISLGNTMKVFGVNIKESIRWREELYEPERYLKPDPKLRETVAALAASYKVAVVTNNPVSIARRTLACLGIDDLIPVIVGLDTCKLSKPHKKIFRKAADLCGVPVKSCVSIGDRFEIDISLPLKIGMGGILVDGVEDVYGLPALL